MKNYRTYLLDSLWDTCLRALISAVALQAICRGCYIADGLLKPVPVCAAALAAQLVLTALTYGRAGRWAAWALWILSAAGVLLLIRRGGDADGALLFALLALCVTGAVFLLGRGGGGAAVLFFGGGILLGGAAFLKYSEGIPQLLAYLCAAGCLYMRQDFRRGARLAGAAGRAGVGLICYSLCVCLLLTGAAWGLYAAVIRPLSPPTVELKLTSRLMSLEVLERIGVSTQIYLDDPNQTSSEEEEGSRITGQTGDEKSDAAAPQSPDREENTPSGSEETPRGYLGDGARREDFQSVAYERGRWGALICALCVVLLPAGAVLVRRGMRKSWLSRLKRQPSAEQARLVYGFFLKRFDKLGLESLPSETPMEYARRLSRQLDGFTGEEGSFAAMSDIFSRCRYGGLDPDEDECRLFFRACEGFYSRCRRQLGGLRYALKYFTL